MVTKHPGFSETGRVRFHFHGRLLILRLVAVSFVARKIALYWILGPRRAGPWKIRRKAN